tara:strand:+ start:98 stop:274 length:177 start_codon:yes stop_codon:yes gene_type:complete
MNPSIPTEPCVVCGIKTNETQSVIGIAHYKCFVKPFATTQKKDPADEGGVNYSTGEKP